MLNIPNCLNFNIIPLEMSLTAPYKSVRDLEMIIKLTYASNERLQNFDTSKLMQNDFDDNNCSQMQLRFDSIKKFCGICKFSDSNVLDRLDDELILLNHLFHNGPDDRIPQDLFKYYFLDSNFNVIKITSLLFNLITENFDSNISLVDIINTWKADNEAFNAKISPMLVKVMENTNLEIDLSISKLSKIKHKSKNIQHTDVLSLLASKQNIVKEKKVTKAAGNIESKPKINKKINTKNKNTSDEFTQLPGQMNLFHFDNNDKINEVASSNLSEEIKQEDQISNQDSTSALSSIEHVENTNYSVIHNNQDCNEYSSLEFDDINTLSIVSGTIFVSTKKELVLSILNQDKGVTNYKLDPHSKSTNDILIHLFMNKNVLKIVDDLINVKNFVSTEVFNSTFDASIISKDSDIVRIYSEVIKNYTVEELEDYKRKNIIKIHTMVNTTTQSNVTFKVSNETDLFKNVVYKASCKKIFDKYLVKVFSCNKDTLELYIENDNNSIAVDYFLTIIRSELKRKNVKKEIEVIIK